jgi:hypothetical protein
MGAGESEVEDGIQTIGQALSSAQGAQGGIQTIGQVQQVLDQAEGEINTAIEELEEDEGLKDVINIQKEVLDKLASNGQQGEELSKSKLKEILNEVRSRTATGPGQQNKELNGEQRREIENEISSLIQKQISSKKATVEFVMPREILGDLGKLCKRLEKVKEEKKEGYQINNSYEISGFNLKMK